MTVVAEREAKAERIEIRVTPNAKALLTAAANARHTTVSEFLLSNGIKAAEQEVAVPRVFYASEEGWAAVEALLDEDEAVPNETNLKWITQRHRKD